MVLRDVEIVEQRDMPKFWKPEQGKYDIRFVENGIVKQDVRLQENEKPVPMFYVGIEVDGTPFTMSTRYREECTAASLLGQLKVLEERFAGLNGVRLKVHISGSGKAKRYVFDFDTAEKIVSDEKG